jgi:hypothetical protein
MFSFNFGPGAFLFLCALLPLVLADNLFAGCYSMLPGNSVAPAAPVLRSSSLDCSVSPLLTLLPEIYERMLIDRMDVHQTLIRTTMLPLDNVSVQTVHRTNKACSWAMKTLVARTTIIEISELHTCR